MILSPKVGKLLFSSLPPSLLCLPPSSTTLPPSLPPSLSPCLLSLPPSLHPSLPPSPSLSSSFSPSQADKIVPFFGELFPDEPLPKDGVITLPDRSPLTYLFPLIPPSSSLSIPYSSYFPSSSDHTFLPHMQSDVILHNTTTLHIFCAHWYTRSTRYHFSNGLHEYQVHAKREKGKQAKMGWAVNDATKKVVLAPTASYRPGFRVSLNKTGLERPYS